MVKHQFVILEMNITIIIYLTDIATDPDDVLAAKGTDVTLTCTATGADDLMYWWIRMGNGRMVLQAVGVNTSSLIIKNVTVDDSGEYKCVVTSDNVTVISECGAVSVVGKLYVFSELVKGLKIMNVTDKILVHGQIYLKTGILCSIIVKCLVMSTYVRNKF